LPRRDADRRRLWRCRSSERPAGDHAFHIDRAHPAFTRVMYAHK